MLIITFIVVLVQEFTIVNYLKFNDIETLLLSSLCYSTFDDDRSKNLLDYSKGNQLRTLNSLKQYSMDDYTQQMRCQKLQLKCHQVSTHSNPP